MWARLDEADSCFREAIALRTGLFGNEHRDVADGLEFLGDVLSAQNRLEAASETLKRAAAMRETLHGSNHVITHMTKKKVDELARLMKGSQRYEHIQSVYGPGLQGSNSVVISRDGRFAYAMGWSANGLCALRRDVETGMLQLTQTLIDENALGAALAVNVDSTQ